MTKIIWRAALACTATCALWAQGPTFEVASMKPSPPPGNVIRVGCTGGPGSTDPGRITCDRMNLRALLMRAFDLKAYQISGPEWLTDVAYDVAATLPPGTSKEQVLKMWQNLLAERLKLTVHHDTKELPIYALVVAKGGLKMPEVPDEAPSGPNSNTGGGSPPSGASGGGGLVGARATSGDPGNVPPGGHRGHLSGPKMQVSQLVTGLNFHVDRPVIDQTGLTGRYKVNLEWVDEATGPAADSSLATSIFAAVQEQLGLKLDPRKAPVDLLVIDHVEKVPTEN